MKKIMVIGNVGQDPELRTDDVGNTFVTFSLGIPVYNKETPKTDWVDISCNGKTAELAKNYIKKGSKLFVEGFPAVHAYVTRENKPTAVLKIYANNIELLNFIDEDKAIE